MRYSFCSWVQMAVLEQLESEMRQEYTVRRRMLIERAKVWDRHRPASSLSLLCAFLRSLDMYGRRHGQSWLTGVCGQVLMHSFMWAERLKDKEAAAGAKAVGDRYTAAMHAEPAVSLSQVFETRQGVLWPPCSGVSML